MEKQQLPNATLILVLSIASILCCCAYGAGIIPAVISLVLANKSVKLYKADPELYDNFSNIKTGRIIAIIGIVLNAVYIVYSIAMIAIFGIDGLMERYQLIQEQYQ
ncbi:CCC motif membrane protein [Sinomicrobium weinanense]|uniref:DUF4190 domain-containing protein n=1 Tax=Sinomicrobium weinanense TaxID=2842200 RepID=A0A926JTQ6_9FLAO|nr:CCC motif membrane protein [Sinomicrobium weinanense]MBC9797370.1 DUF4190 domain-containing protein [Sinomicrobium weinanense]MBU3123399.1 DUF4190 domain-containing protein [Sinomicrobium weinanense]